MDIINVVIPMAGEGSRFARAGYSLPKPFIDVRGKMMIERVLDNLAMDGARYILLARSEHLNQYPMRKKHIETHYSVEFVTVDQLTLGAACTVLAAHRLINNDMPLLIANSDQLVDMAIDAFVEDGMRRNLEGSILTFQSDHPKWSYVRLDEAGYLLELREKQVISDEATVGIYLFRRGCDFVKGAIDMIVANDRVNQEFYVAPVYNYLVKQGQTIGTYRIDAGSMHGLGTPEDLCG